MCSRGSVIPLFIDQIKSGKPLTVTVPEMTRFIMSMEDAIELVLFAFEHGESGDIFVQKAPACSLQVLTEAIKELFGAGNSTETIGVRHGEKMYETLLTNEEFIHATDMGGFYRVPADRRDLNYDKNVAKEAEKKGNYSELNSNTTALLDIEAVKQKLLQLEYIQDALKGWGKANEHLGDWSKRVRGEKPRRKAQGQ